MPKWNRICARKKATKNQKINFPVRVVLHLQLGALLLPLLGVLLVGERHGPLDILHGRQDSSHYFYLLKFYQMLLKMALKSTTIQLFNHTSWLNISLRDSLTKKLVN
jgi:hypothetical protein